MYEDRMYILIKIYTSPTIGLPENALIPSWNLGAILLTCSTIFLSLTAIIRRLSQIDALI